MSWETVHDTRIFLGNLQKIIVYLVAVEILHSLLLRGLVAHADPDIRVQQVRFLSRFYVIMRHINISARGSRGFLRFPENRRVWFLALRACQGNYHSLQGPAD